MATTFLVVVVFSVELSSGTVIMEEKILSFRSLLALVVVLVVVVRLRIRAGRNSVSSSSSVIMVLMTDYRTLTLLFAF